MGVKKSNPEMIKYFIENALLQSERKLAAKFDVSAAVVKRIFRENDIVVPREIQLEFKRQSMIGRTSFTEEQTQFIKDNYLKIPIKRMGIILNKSGCGVAGRMRQLGLVVPPELVAQRKADSMYRKGAVPANKGKKQTEYMSAEAIEKTKGTRFKKGQDPHNALKDWQETIRTDKRYNRQYILIKIPGNRKIMYKQIYIWEQANKTKLPKGKNIVFKDGNTLNCVIENLECITDAQLMKRNTHHRYPKEISSLILLKGALTRQINKQLKSSDDVNNT